MRHLTQLVTKWMRSFSQATRPGAAARPAKPRLGVEGLEDRLTPTTVFNYTDGITSTCGGASTTLRDAVICTPSGGTIQMMLPGTYTLNWGASGDQTPASGDLDIRQQNLTIEPAPGMPPCSVSIDGNFFDRIFDILPNASVTIRDIELRNGFPVDSYGVLEDGGAIRNNGRLTFDQCGIYTSTAVRGGAIANFTPGLSLVVSRATIDANYADLGGGIYNETAQAVLRDTDVSNNGAQVGGGLWNNGRVDHFGVHYLYNWANEGGGINNLRPGFIWMTQSGRLSKLVGNVAFGRGGGMFNESGNVRIECGIVDSNYAGFEGGGLWTIVGRFDLWQTTVMYNVAGSDGGGLWTASPTTILNSTFSGNWAWGTGGGIWHADGSSSPLTIRHGTITQNIAVSGSGLYTTATSAVTSTALLHNTILAENYEYNSWNLDDGFGKLNDQGRRNLVSLDWGSGLQIGVPYSNLLNVLPMLDPLNVNPGPCPTPTHKLQTGSPAINAADAGLAYTLTTDQRGNNRGPLPDIGAYETP